VSQDFIEFVFQNMTNLMEKKNDTIIPRVESSSSSSQQKKRRRLHGDDNSSTLSSLLPQSPRSPRSPRSPIGSNIDWLLVREPLFNSNGSSDRPTVILYLSIQECIPLTLTCRYIAYCQRLRLQRFLNTSINGTAILNHPYWHTSTAFASTVLTSSSSSLVSASSSASTLPLSLSSIQLSLDHIWHCIVENDGELLMQTLNHRKWKNANTETTENNVFATSTMRYDENDLYDEEKVCKLNTFVDIACIEIQRTHVPGFIWITIYDSDLCRNIINENDDRLEDSKIRSVWSVELPYVTSFIEMFKRNCRNKCDHIVKLIEAWEQMVDKLDTDNEEFGIAVQCGNIVDPDGLVVNEVRLRLDFNYNDCREPTYLKFMVFLTQLAPRCMISLLFPKTILPIVFPRHRSIVVAAKKGKIEWNSEYPRKWNGKMQLEHRTSSLSSSSSYGIYDWLLIRDPLFNCTTADDYPTVIAYLSVPELCIWSRTCKNTAYCHRVRILEFLNTTANATSVVFDEHHLYPLSSSSIIPLIDDHIRYCLCNNVGTFKRLARQRKLRSFESEREYITTSSRVADEDSCDPIMLYESDDVSILIQAKPAPDYIYIELSNMHNIDLYKEMINANDPLTIKFDDNDDSVKARSTHNMAFIELLKNKCRQYEEPIVSELISSWQQMMLNSGKDNYDISVEDCHEGLHVLLGFEFDNWRSDSYLEFLFYLTRLDLFGMTECLFPEELSNIVFPKHRSLSVVQRMPVLSSSLSSSSSS
jgi:hypothetical protein